MKGSSGLVSSSRKPEIHVLRTRLQNECSDLRLLTDAELIECKWVTKRKVFVGLLSVSPSLNEQHEELLDILEKRNVDSNKNKAAPVDRAVRSEEEMNHRTKFLRVVLSALTKLRWPPTLEAFSDPIDLLFNDVHWVLNAFQFILDIAVPKSSNRFDRDSSSASMSSLRYSGSPEKTSPSKSEAANNHPSHSSEHSTIDLRQQPSAPPTFHGAHSMEVSALDISELSMSSGKYLDPTFRNYDHNHSNRPGEKMNT